MGNQNFDSESSKTYIDFFAGCGGLSLGLGWAGWNGVFAVEKDPMAYESFDKNLVDVSAPHRHFYNWPIWLTREAHSIEDILENPVLMQKFETLKGKITLIAGGPPCQGFSVAGARNGSDPRNLLVFKQIRAIEAIKPIFAIVENVEGFERKFVSRPLDGLNISVADEAVQAITYFIDDAIQFNARQVRVLHGTGTGALRQYLRQYLDTVNGVRSYRDEHVQFGGAGITIIELE